MLHSRSFIFFKKDIAQNTSKTGKLKQRNSEQAENIFLFAEMKLIGEREGGNEVSAKEKAPDFVFDTGRSRYYLLTRCF